MAPPDVSYVSLDPEINNSPEDTTSVNRENKTTLYYTLPAVRFSSVFKTLIIIDTLTSLTLWILGGNSEYFVDNISNFHFMESVFDLALLAMLKCVLSFILLDCLEIKNMLQIDKPFDWNLRRKIVMLHVTLWLFFILCVVFTFTKGGMILYAILYRENYEMMHITYNVLCICAASFTMLEFLSVLYSMRAMKKLKIYRIKHIVNEDGQEIDEEGKAIQKKVDIKRLIGLAKPESSLLAIGFICLVGASGGNMIAPLYFGKVVDAALQSMEALTKTVLILLGIYLGGSILAMFRAFTFTLAGQRVVARLRKELFNRIIKQEVAFFDKNRTGELTNRLSSDTQVVQNALTVNISMLLRNILTIIGSLGFMFALNPAMTGILLAIVPVISIATVNYGKYVKKLREKFQKKLADASTVAEECLSSMRTVRMFNCEVKSMNFYKVHIDESYVLGKYLSVASGVFECLIGFLSYGAICVVLWYGGKLVNEKTLSPGILTSFLLYTLQVALSFGTLSAIYGDFMQAVGASVRIFGLLDRIPEFRDDGFYSEDRMEGCVEFHNVKFTYPSRPETEVLRGLTFSVNTGEMVALVGPSGGGKSTIVSLVERFYDPDSGKIFLGNMAIDTLNPKWFRTHMSMVSQEPTLFACSIRENIAYGRDATHDEIVEVSRKANAHDFIMEFEKGYDTAVGERGIRLSGGQKQRVAIARALIMNPSILLLDEATSALDAESEHLVQEAIDRAMKGRTVIVIAHRLSTVRNATKVLVIDKGQIVEQGTHDELIANKGVYKKLVLRQLNAGAISTIDDDVQTYGNSVASADKVAEVVEVAEGEIIKLE